jgi:hypothetical protein
MFDKAITIETDGRSGGRTVFELVGGYDINSMYALPNAGVIPPGRVHTTVWQDCSSKSTPTTCAPGSTYIYGGESEAGEKNVSPSIKPIPREIQHARVCRYRVGGFVAVRRTAHQLGTTNSSATNISSVF